MADPFEGSRRKLARAKKHIVDFDRRVQAFLDERPCSPVTEPDADRRYNLVKIRFNKPLPEALMDITADAAHNLRDALDLAGYGVAVASGRVDPRHTYFPFAPSATELEHQLGGRCKDLPDEIVALFRNFKPYKGGNDLLWALNRIANTTKHKLLIPMGISAGTIEISDLKITSDASPFIDRPRMWDRLKNEITFLRLPIDADPDYNLHVSLFIAFGEIEIVGGKPAVGVLVALTSEVERVLMAIEAETRRLFPAAFP